MTESTVTLIDASVGSTPAQRNIEREVGLPVATWKVSEGELPPGPEEGWDDDGVVVSGSQTAVYENREWIDETVAWLGDAIEAGVPVLGICWGHQAIARAAGGTVEDMGEYELGYATVEQVRESPLFAGLPESFVAFESHSDVVAELPPEATLLAENDVGVQAFHVENAFGVQFHPEYDRETAQWVVENKEGELPDERIEEIRETITPKRHAKTAAATHVFDNFESLLP